MTYFKIQQNGNKNCNREIRSKRDAKITWNYVNGFSLYTIDIVQNRIWQNLIHKHKFDVLYMGICIP